MSGESETLVLSGKIEIPYRWTAGGGPGLFLTALRDEKVFLATRCARCRRTSVPGENSCGKCGAAVDDWVEVGPGGRLVGFAVVHRRRLASPVDPPYAVARIRLDGADNDFLHLVCARDQAKLHGGTRVVPVFREERSGTLADVVCFEPEAESAACEQTSRRTGGGAAPVRHLKQTVTVRYAWSCGKNLTAFFRETRDRKRFVGRRCPKCRAVHVPPVEACGKCFVRCEEDLIEVGPGGRLDSWTTVHLPFPGQPTEPPYVFAMIQLDGANTLLSHRVAGADEEDLRIGMRVEPVWSEERKGNLHDVLYFRPAVASALEEPERAPATPEPKEEKMEITVHDIFQAMEKNFLPAGAGDWKAAIQFEISGPGGGDWLVRIGDGTCAAGPGRADVPTATVSTSAETWIGMVTGSVNPQMAFMTGKLKVKGNMGDVMKLSNPKIFPKKPPER